MIIAKKSRRHALRLILIILCLSIFVGCSQTEGDAFLALGEMMESAETDQMRCEIIYGGDASATLVDAARKLAQEVEEQTGMDTVTHSGAVDYISGCFYIVLGRVDDGVTYYWYHGMKADDYVCRAYENIVALGGVSEDATLAAIERFEDDVLPTAENGYFADDGVVFRHVGEYGIDKILLNGYELGDYTILSDTQALDTVCRFRERIAQASGDYPVIVTGKPSSENMNIVISVDVEYITSTVSFRTENKNVYIETDSIYGLAAGLDELYARFMENTTDNVASLDIKEEFLYEYSDARLSVSCFALDNAAIDNGDAKTTAEAMVNSDADVVIVDVTDDMIWGVTEPYIVDTKIYEVTQITMGDELVASVLYKPHTVRLEDTSTESINGLLTLELGVHHIGGEKDYTLLGFFGHDATYAHTFGNTMIEKMEQTDGYTVAVFAIDENILGALSTNADGYNSNINAVTKTQNLTYRMGAFTSDTLECFEKYVAGDKSSCFAVAAVDVRLKYFAEKL